MEMREIFGLATGLLVLAGLSMAIVNGGNTAAVVKSLSDAFSSNVAVATQQNRAG